ncbi:hypothetical protein NS861_08550, partial [Pseudomonas aeruginosa]|nr:hypothetical protein [Pseudomonas aeruginosa]
ISSADRMIAPENHERMAARIAPRKIVTLDASHASLASSKQARPAAASCAALVGGGHGGLVDQRRYFLRSRGQ